MLVDISDPAQKLRCTFYEIDRKLGSVSGGSRVVAVGRGRQDGSLLCVSLEQADSQQDSHLPRMENFAVRGIRLGLHYHNLNKKMSA